MGKINVLSKEISELIAAGEVIDRPSSIVKELLENAIDSGASLITTEIKNGGRTFIRVTDNGGGIAYDDVPTAFLRHATSKISSKSDLDGIMTLGFRGEALASICAVSKVDVLTKRPEDGFGCRYRICGAVEEEYEQAGCPDGTTIIVRDIFYNVPARLKFLKKDVTEGNAIAAIVSKLALSHPEISFKFIRDNKTDLLTAGDGKPSSAIYCVFGREFASSMIPLDYSYNGVSVSGYICKPHEAKANHSFQNYFINHRYVKSLTCMHAVDEAYANLLMTGKVASCVLFLDIPPGIIDVNVHPTKIEVRFSNEKLIYDSVYFAVKNALMSSGSESMPSAEPAVKRFTDEQLRPAFANQPVQQTKLFDTSAPVAHDAPQYAAKSVIRADEMMSQRTDEAYSPACEPSSRVVMQTPQGETPESIEFKYINESSFERRAPQPQAQAAEDIKEITPILIGEVFKTYIIVQAGEDMYLIDKHAAHERFIFEKIKSDTRNLDTQLLLEPVMVQLSFEEYDAVCANLDTALKAGLLIEPDVAPTVAVKGVPLIIADINPAEVVTLIAENFLASKVDAAGIDIFDELYHSIACKAAIKANDDSSQSELEVIAKAVLSDEKLRYCPHGRPIIVRMTKKDIEKQFRRVL